MTDWVWALLRVHNATLYGEALADPKGLGGVRSACEEAWAWNPVHTLCPIHSPPYPCHADYYAAPAVTGKSWD